MVLGCGDGDYWLSAERGENGWLPLKFKSGGCGAGLLAAGVRIARALCRERAGERGSRESRRPVLFHCTLRSAWGRGGHGVAGEWRAPPAGMKNYSRPPRCCRAHGTRPASVMPASRADILRPATVEPAKGAVEIAGSSSRRSEAPAVSRSPASSLGGRDSHSYLQDFPFRILSLVWHVSASPFLGL